ncbi:unknown [Prevotella sp. CAG:386]|jgi:hypothetical protein|nr:unknown [Prevotella sp. CAG:386]
MAAIISQKYHFFAIIKEDDTFAIAKQKNNR